MNKRCNNLNKTFSLQKKLKPKSYKYIWYPNTLKQYKLQLTMNSFCSFCAGAGIQGPHDHTTRSSKALGSKVICPILLATKCTLCCNIGHTNKFCTDRIQTYLSKHKIYPGHPKKVKAGEWSWPPSRVRPVNNVGANPPTESSGRMMTRFSALKVYSDNSSSEDEEFPPPPTPSPPPVVRQVGRSWADIINTPPKSYSEDKEFPPFADRVPPPVVRQDGRSWADIINTPPKSCSEDDEDLPPFADRVPPPVVRQLATSWADIINTPPKSSGEDDEELPPLVFGKRFNTRWADSA